MPKHLAGRYNVSPPLEGFKQPRLLEAASVIPATNVPRSTDRFPTPADRPTISDRFLVEPRVGLPQPTISQSSGPTDVTKGAMNPPVAALQVAGSIGHRATGRPASKIVPFAQAL